MTIWLNQSPMPAAFLPARSARAKVDAAFCCALVVPRGVRSRKGLEYWYKPAREKTK